MRGISYDGTNDRVTSNAITVSLRSKTSDTRVHGNAIAIKQVKLLNSLRYEETIGLQDDVILSLIRNATNDVVAFFHWQIEFAALVADPILQPLLAKYRVWVLKARATAPRQESIPRKSPSLSL